MATRSSSSRVFRFLAAASLLAAILIGGSMFWHRWNRDAVIPTGVAQAQAVEPQTLAQPAVAAKQTVQQEPAPVETVSTDNEISVELPETLPENSSPEELQRKYPLQSLEDRLAYENDLPEDRPQPHWSDEARKAYQEQVQAHVGMEERNPRRLSLAMLHSTQARQFINSPGFGYSRMMVAPSPSYLPAPEMKPVPLAKAADQSAQAHSGGIVQLPKSNQPGVANILRLPSQEAVTSFHFASYGSFLNPWLMGYAKSRTEVAGFQPHQFTHMPELAVRSPEKPAEETDNLPAQEPTEKWLVTQLELVSLLKHERPMAYVSPDHLPRMQELDQVQTRELTGGERQSLKQLQDGQDIAIIARPNVIHMLGSLRATGQCMNCHNVQEGELLGAFTYKLQRDPPVKDAGVAEKPTL